ncbi:MAG: pseudouridine synthase [Phycisphaerales bacterium]
MSSSSRNHDNLPAELRDESRGTRLHKAMADAGIGSRRACEQLIAERRVTVNGHLIKSMPVWVDPAADRIEVDHAPIARQRKAQRKLYLMVFKPRRVICTNRDELGRKRVIDLVPHPERLFCVGRLDAESTGFVLLTNDGELAQHLTHPSFEVPKTYRVAVKGRVEGEHIERLRRGMTLADRAGETQRTNADLIKIIKRDLDRTVMEITLSEGRNREIRRMMARLGLDVKRLERIAIGPVHLKGVAPGHWRELTKVEIAQLRKKRRTTSDER